MQTSFGEKHVDLGQLLPSSLVTPVTDGLDAVERRLHAVTAASTGLTQLSCRHLLAAGGKRFRPLVALLAAVAAAPAAPGRRARDVAVAVELLHLSTLYHDDVIDAADVRRGVPSANRRFGDRLAVVAGNRLTALALEAAADVGGEVPGLLARTYARLVAGERLETRLVGRLDAGQGVYLEVIDGKTAALVAASARAGAAAADAPARTRDALESWGRTVGLAFQVADDLLDLTATQHEAGKPVGHDVELGVYTWPVLDALATTSGDELRRLLAGPLPHPPEVVAQAVALIASSGSIERATRFVHRLLQRADGHLDALPAGPATQALRGLGRSLVPLDDVRTVAVPRLEAQAVGA